MYVTFPGMRLPNDAHISRPWRVHAIAQDFSLEDVWALPTPGGRSDFPRLVQRVVTADPSSGATRALWAIRWRLGHLLGWDSARAGLGSRVPTLRDRLPTDLRNTPGPDFAALPFKPLYLTEDEFAAEIANATMHGILHLGWVPDGQGRYRGQLAVLVKRNGLLGAAYMAAIKPFRHLLVYPAMLRQLEREWPSATAPGTGSSAAAGRRPAAGSSRSTPGGSPA